MQKRLEIIQSDENRMRDFPDAKPEVAFCKVRIVYEKDVFSDLDLTEDIFSFIFFG